MITRDPVHYANNVGVAYRAYAYATGRPVKYDIETVRLATQLTY